jgi:hypothetical protein
VTATLQPFKGGVMKILERARADGPDPPVIPMALTNLWGSFFSRIEQGGARHGAAVPARACSTAWGWAFMGWGLGSARFNFTGFSGHTAISTSVWSVALWMVAARRSPAVRRVAVAAGWALGAAIGASRLAIFAHSVSEVAAGLLLGITICLAFLWLVRRQPAPRAPWPVMLLGLLLPLAFQTPGAPAPTQDLLEAIAVRLAGVERPYTRDDLQRM